MPTFLFLQKMHRKSDLPKAMSSKSLTLHISIHHLSKFTKGVIIS